MRLKQEKPNPADEFVHQLKAVGIQGFTRELLAIPGRKFRIDVAFPAARLAVECMGGVWTDGRHTRGPGYTTDCEKACLLAIEGWQYMPVTSEQIKSGHALQWVEAALRAAKRRLDR
jgi:hypothetical protein